MGELSWRYHLRGYRSQPVPTAISSGVIVQKLPSEFRWPRYRELTRSNWKGLGIQSRSQTLTLKTGNCQDNREAGERGDRNESPDAHAVHRENLTMKLASTRRLDRVTSPFPGFLHRKIHHIHRLGDFRDVHGGINSDSPPYDAISDVFLALPPVPVELHALRLHLACSGRLF